MRTPTRLAFYVLGGVLIQVSTGAAQPSRAAQPTAVVRVPDRVFSSCGQEPPADDALAHCGLWFKHHWLVRGTAGTQLSRSTFLHPAALSRYARGDSALLYASRYEHDTWRGEQLVLLGGSAAISEVLMARRFCQDIWCSHDARKARMRVFFIGGSVVTGFGVKTLLKSVVEGNRAMWFSNATLTPGGLSR